MDVHLVDGTYELFRQYFGQPSRRADDGQEIGAVRGVLLSLLGMIADGATHVGVATDHVVESFRNDLWPGYKTGEGIEPELRSQFGILETALEALGLVVWPMAELEADDALASAASVAAGDPAVAPCRDPNAEARCPRGASCSAPRPMCLRWRGNSDGPWQARRWRDHNPSARQALPPIRVPRLPNLPRLLRNACVCRAPPQMPARLPAADSAPRIPIQRGTTGVPAPTLNPDCLADDRLPRALVRDRGPMQAPRAADLLSFPRPPF